MTDTVNLEQPHIATTEMDGRRFHAMLRIVHDGVEYVGRLWFADEAWEDRELPDRGPFSGRTPEEVLAAAKRLTDDELRARYKRALAEKRRYLGLRRTTEQILTRIRYLNTLAVSIRGGKLEETDAQKEIAACIAQLHELVDSLASVAGIEE
jgi:hypothetical protein